jgi:phosphoribosylanthranilate isomerase
VFVKVCGLRTRSDVDVAVAAGADAIGFVFAESVRKVDASTVRLLTADVPEGVLPVGVFAGIPTSEAGRIAQQAGVSAVQLHGDYPPQAFEELADTPLRLIRATTLTEDTAVTAGACGEDMLLLDSPVAGSGERWDLSVLARSMPTGNWLLAGGLTPRNVATAIQTAQPWGVDVSSGVESARGVKDHALIREFISNAKAA